MLVLNEEQPGQNHVSVTPSFMKNIEVSGQWILQKLPWATRGRYFLMPTGDPLQWFKACVQLFDTPLLRDEGLCPLSLNLDWS